MISDSARRAFPSPVARLLHRALLWKKRMQFRGYTLTKSVEGDSLQFHVADATARQWYGWHDPTNPEVLFIRGMVSPGDLVFDVGSHHGFYTLVMARRALRVIAIEPNPYNVVRLEKNIALNHSENVSVRQTAVGGSKGKISLLCESDWGGVQSSDTKTLPTIDVDVVRLDDLAEEYGFPQFLKIDVEGFEAGVLRGALRILERRPKVAIEVHVDWVARYGSSVAEVIELLNLESYRVSVLAHGGTEVRPWDGSDLTKLPPPKFHLFLLPLTERSPSVTPLSGERI
jgi:FkbM family methyltransferase